MPSRLLQATSKTGFVWFAIRSMPIAPRGVCGRYWRFLLRWTIYCAIVVFTCAASFARAESKTPARNEAPPDARVDFLPIKLTVVDRQDIRFRRLSGSAGLSQTRVSSAVQDNLGFIWVGK